MMLRRLKEDVEKNLAPKQETIIEVSLNVLCCLTSNTAVQIIRPVFQVGLQMIEASILGVCLWVYSKLKYNEDNNQ